MSSDDAPHLHDEARARLREGLSQERARAEHGHGVPSSDQERAAPRDLVGPAHPEAQRLYQDAMEALEREDRAQAEDALRRSLSRQDAFPGTWRELALLLAEDRRHEECLRAAEQLLTRAPGDPDGLRLRAQALDGLGDEEGAARGWTALMEHEGELPPAFRRQAGARLQRLAPEPAPTESSGFASNRMPRLDPPRPTGPGGEAGQAYEEALGAIEAEDPERGEAALRRSLSRDDGAPEAWRELGILLVDLDRLAEAIRPLQEALRRAPDDLESRRALAVAADRTGDVELAALSYQGFLDGCSETSYQRQRLHAERRLAALRRGEVDVAPEFATGEVVELARGWTPGQRVAAGALGLVLILWMLGGGGSPPVPPESTGRRGPPRVQELFLREADARLPGAGAPVATSLELVDRARALMRAGVPDPVDVVSHLLEHPSDPVVAGVIDVLVEDAGAGARAALSAYVVRSHARQERASVEAAAHALLATEDPRRVVTLVRALAVAARRQSRKRPSRQHISMLEGLLGELPEDEVAREARSHLIRATPARGQADRNVQEAMRAWIGH